MTTEFSIQRSQARRAEVGLLMLIEQADFNGTELSRKAQFMQRWLLSRLDEIGWKMYKQRLYEMIGWERYERRYKQRLKEAVRLNRNLLKAAAAKETV